MNTKALFKKRGRALLQEMGRQGGHARKKALTKEQRRTIARKAARARWSKKESK